MDDDRNDLTVPGTGESSLVPAPPAGADTSWAPWWTAVASNA